MPSSRSLPEQRSATCGAYERVRGTFKGELDPRDARNRVIANLDKAPRNAAGNVEYEADFFMLRPASAERANGKLVYDVTNRGRLNFHWRFTEAKRRSNDPRTMDDVGDGLFFRQGYTFVWSGWDPEAPTQGNGLAMKPVIATDAGAPITRTIREEFVAGTRDRGEGDGGSRSEGHVFRLFYEPATLDQSAAKLTVRRTNAAPAARFPRANGRMQAAARYSFCQPARNPNPDRCTNSTTSRRTRACSGSAWPRRAISWRFCVTRRADAQGAANPARREDHARARVRLVPERTLPARFRARRIQPGRARAAKSSTA